MNQYAPRADFGCPNICHLAGITARLGRTLNWNDKTEQIVGDEQANAMLSRDYRQGYEIEMGAATSRG